MRLKAKCEEGMRSGHESLMKSDVKWFCGFQNGDDWSCGLEGSGAGVHQWSCMEGRNVLNAILNKVRVIALSLTAKGTMLY